jgi:hypothetical protein
MPRTRPDPFPFHSDRCLIGALVVGLCEVASEFGDGIRWFVGASLPCRLSLLALLILLPFLSTVVRSQALGPIITIPIDKVREHSNNLAETGKGKSCGVRLFDEWPAYLNYTNSSSYRIFTPGLQSIPSPQNSVPPGGRFRFYCYFNGISTPFIDSVCPDKIGEQHPDWYVEIQRRGPRASFTSRAMPPVPGEFEFNSNSTDPEGEPVLESWRMGDDTTRGGTSLIHRYSKPGNFTVSLTVADTDALTNMASRVISVPAPRPLVSVRLLNKHTGNRIELAEEFTARVTVAASDDGVGSLSNLVFTTPALTVPGLFTVLSAPAQTNIGTLPPGGKVEFDWRLRAWSRGTGVRRRLSPPSALSAARREKSSRPLRGSVWDRPRRVNGCGTAAGNASRPSRLRVRQDMDRKEPHAKTRRRAAVCFARPGAIRSNAFGVMTPASGDGRIWTLPALGMVCGAAMSSSSLERHWNGDEDVATPFHAGGSIQRCPLGTPLET